MPSYPGWRNRPDFQHHTSLAYQAVDPVGYDEVMSEVPKLRWSIFEDLFGLLTVYVALALSGCQPPPSTSIGPPAGWIAVKASQFVFYVPPDMKQIPAQAEDSEEALYQGNSISLSYDYGPWSDPLKHTEKPQFKGQAERIDGRLARIVSFSNPGSGHPFDNAIAVHFSDTGKPKMKLTLFATCKTTKDYETVKTIFRTIKFKKP